MEAFYNVLSGPALWLSFMIFSGGLITGAAFLVGASREQDGHLVHGFGEFG